MRRTCGACDREGDERDMFAATSDTGAEVDRDVWLHRFPNDLCAARSRRRTMRPTAGDQLARAGWR